METTMLHPDHFPSILRWVSWNLFLAVIPVVMGYWIAGSVSARIRAGKKVNWGAWLIAVGVWFFFLPNTCYLLTEWRHFLSSVDSNNLYIRSYYGADRGALMTIALEALFYACFSGAGVLTFALAIRPLEKLGAQLKLPLRAFAPIFFFLNSLGVYLGLVLRFNTWDLTHRPQIIVNEAIAAMSRPILGGSIVVFGFFLWALYKGVDLWIDALSARFSRKPSLQLQFSSDDTEAFRRQA